MATNIVYRFPQIIEEHKLKAQSLYNSATKNQAILSDALTALDFFVAINLFPKNSLNKENEIKKIFFKHLITEKIF
uniref:Uncharacterized protein n=1 Tax=Meloidogyne enterolobii TaxID=390850 RepID=A0A6V7UDW9_MELEN|nr:unnamed protein product [Meloidogyne enterolobii]